MSQSGQLGVGKWPGVKRIRCLTPPPLHPGGTPTKPYADSGPGSPHNVERELQHLSDHQLEALDLVTRNQSW